MVFRVTAITEDAAEDSESEVTCNSSEGKRRNGFLIYSCNPFHMHCLQCFDTVGWAAGRASGL